MKRLLGCLLLTAALAARAESLNELTWLTEDFPPYNYAVDDQAFGLMVDVLLEASRAVDDSGRARQHSGAALDTRGAHGRPGHQLGAVQPGAHR